MRTPSLFKVVASGIQAGDGPSVVRTYLVSKANLNTEFKRLTASGARILSVTPPEGETVNEELTKKMSKSPTPLNKKANPTLTKSSEITSKKPITKKKSSNDIPVNTYKQSKPLVATVAENYTLLKEGGIGSVQHITIDLSSADPSLKYVEGQSLAVLPTGLNEKGKPHKQRLYSIASTRHGDNYNGDTVSLCVRLLEYKNENGEQIYGVCSKYLTGIKPGEKIKVAGPVGKIMLLPEDEEANIIMLATGTGIAPFRAFLRRMFEPTEREKNNWDFRGKAWLFMGAPVTANLLYDADFVHYQKEFPENFTYTKAISREEKNLKGGRMYIQDRVLEHADDVFTLIEKENTHTYMCGLRGMEPGIDEAMATAAKEKGFNWPEMVSSLRKAHRWHVETY